MISGSIVSDARIGRAMPGKDEVMAWVFPTCELPQRPVMCLGARSRAVTAP